MIPGARQKIRDRWRRSAIRILAGMVGAGIFAAGLLLAFDLFSLRMLLAGLGGTSLAIPAAKLHARVLALVAHRGAQILELGLGLMGLGLVLVVVVTAFRPRWPSGRI